MTSPRRVRLVAVSAFGLVAALGIALVAMGSSTHYTSGGAGSADTDGNHSANPGHVWTRIGAPVSAQVSSGGRFHDSCSRLGGHPASTAYPAGHKDVCYGANGGQYAIDQAASAGNGPYTPIKLSVDWAGWASGYTTQPNITGPTIAYYVVAGPSGLYDGISAGCSYKRFDVYVEYTDLSDGYHYELMGYIYFAHGFNWVHTSGTTIYSNQSRWLPDGSQQWYLDSITIGYVYPEHNNVSHPACTSRDHVHTEWISTHNFGAVYEPHGWGPDYYVNYHVHGAGGDYPTPVTPYSSYSEGDWIGFLGGNTILNAIW